MDGELGKQLRKNGETKIADLHKTKGNIGDLYTLDVLISHRNSPEEGTKPLPAELMPQDVTESLNNYWNETENGRPVNVKRYYHSDYIGTVTHISDSEGDLISNSAFYPFGAVKNRYGYRNIYTFTGAEQDDVTELGLIRMGARYYAPKIGRWISPDLYYLESPERSVESTLNLNGYSYSLNNPIVLKDSDGNDPTAPFRFAIGGAAGAVFSGGFNLFQQTALKESVLSPFRWSSFGGSIAV